MPLAWSASRMSNLVTRFPAIVLDAIEVIGGRSRSCRNACERSPCSGSAVGAGPPSWFRATNRMTATVLGTVRRTLAAWEHEGILSGKRASHMIIAQPHRLVEADERA